MNINESFIMARSIHLHLQFDSQYFKYIGLDFSTILKACFRALIVMDLTNKRNVNRRASANITDEIVNLKTFYCRISPAS